jgi:protein gp37
MAENSKIEWTDHTFNAWVGCTKVSPGCDHCYAESWAKRTGRPWLWTTRDRKRTTPAYWRQPLKWHAAVPDGERRRVFCASLADVFDNEADPQWRVDLFDLVRATPRLDWLLLTKRIGNVRTMLPPDWNNSITGYNNVWLGISVVNQEEADRDIPKLLNTPARIHFLSCEPLLGPIDLRNVRHSLRGESYMVASVLEADDGFGLNAPRNRIDWVICGGESGPHARPMEAQWAHALRVQCALARIPFFMKQGSQANWPAFKNFDSFPSGLQAREWPTDQHRRPR